MKNTLARGAWLVLSTLSPAALAVGLGQASALSPLQAPLDARIELVQADGVPVEQISAAVAEPSAFTAAGLTWSPLLAGVAVTPVRQNGRSYLRLESPRVIDTPWLDVLVTLDTPTGRQTRAVTLLFDPVDYLPGAEASTLAQTPSAISSSSSPLPSAAAPAPVAASAPVPPSATHATVARGDTLWDIALRTRAPGVDVQQMIIALADANPEAFADGNIDSLRVGQRLRLPERDEALSLSPQQAAQAVNARSGAGASGTDQMTAVASATQPSPGAQPALESDTALVGSEADEGQGAVGEGESALPTGPGIREALAAIDDLPRQAPTTLSLAPESIEAALAVSGEPIPDGRAWANSPLATDVLGQVLASLSPFATVEAAPTESQYQALLEEQDRQAAQIVALERQVAELRQTLGEVQSLAAQPQALARPEAAPTSASTSGFMDTLRQHWVWPVGLGLALLLAAMVISRRRRERQWEPAPAAAAVPPERAPSPPKPAPTPAAAAKPTVAPTPAQEPVSQKAASHDKVRQETASQAPAALTAIAFDERAEFPPRPPLAPEAPADETLGQENAATPSMSEMPDATEPNPEPATEQSPMPESPAPQTLALERRALSGHGRIPQRPSQWLDEDETERHAPQEPETPAQEPFEPAEEALALTPKRSARPLNHTIDYRPESLDIKPRATEPAPVADRAPAEPEWEIEEVAFKPRGRDNN
ncbi:FimV/HubP family polar landmark protein [Halomonas sp. HNIBRBA4712]|uniref:FimV/HubP family polar landmark protein n=1 Tax=Halomonas sp. HNIBRBA4712 TaxID=3373087 RepID=UPI003745C566